MCFIGLLERNRKIVYLGLKYAVVKFSTDFGKILCS